MHLNFTARQQRMFAQLSSLNLRLDPFKDFENTGSSELEEPRHMKQSFHSSVQTHRDLENVCSFDWLMVTINY